MDPKRQQCAPVLMRLCALFGLWNMQQDMQHYLKEGYINSDQCDQVKQACLRLCDEVRSEAVPLVDAFNYSDAGM